MNNQITVGDRIKKIRASKGISQKQLANTLKVSQAAVSQFEKNEKEPKIETIKKIANALGVPYTDLLEPFPWEEFTKGMHEEITERLHHYGLLDLYESIRALGYTVSLNLSGVEDTENTKDFIFNIKLQNDKERSFTLSELKELQKQSLSFLDFKLNEFKDK